MVVRDLWNWATALLSEKANARYEAEVILRYALGYSRASFLASVTQWVQPSVVDEVRSLVRQRAEGKPLQYLVGEQEFMGLSFKVTPDVLIPRADTEVLVETVLAYARQRCSQGLPCGPMADVGTGSGAIACSLAHHLPTVTVYAVDIRPEAVDISRENSNRLHVSDRVCLIQGNMCEPLEAALPPHSLTAIVSNPPYIPTATLKDLQIEVQHEPRHALDGGADGLVYYRQLTRQAPPLLSEGGLLAVEVGYDQSQDVKRLFIDAGFTSVTGVQDYGGRDRVVWGLVS